MNAPRGYLKTWTAALGCIAGFSFVVAHAIRCPFPPSETSSGYVIKLNRTGGYLGVDEELRVYPDGRIINAIGQTARVSPEDVGEWRKIFNDLKTSDKAPQPAVPIIPLPMCMDCITWRVTVYDKNRAASFVLTGVSGSGSTPLGMNLEKLHGRLRRLDWK